MTTLSPSASPSWMFHFWSLTALVAADGLKVRVRGSSARPLGCSLNAGTWAATSRPSLKRLEWLFRPCIAPLLGRPAFWPRLSVPLSQADTHGHSLRWSSAPPSKQLSPRRIRGDNLRSMPTPQPGIWSRVGPLWRVLEAAAASEPELRDFKQEQEPTRLKGLTRLADSLRERNALRPSLTPSHAAVITQGWTSSDYESWLSDTLQRCLLV